MNVKARSLIFNACWLLIAAGLLGLAGSETRLYRNKSFGFSLELPADFNFQEHKNGDLQTGLTLKSADGIIDIRVMGAGINYLSMPFDDYARIAASAEIQNYDSLVSIESFISIGSIKGYRTFWKVVQTVPPEDIGKERLYRP